MAISSITTDMGNELGIVTLSWMTDVFFRWLEGATITSMHGSIDQDSRFFQRPYKFQAGATCGRAS